MIATCWNSRYLVKPMKSDTNIKTFENLQNIPLIHKIYSDLFGSNPSTVGFIEDTNYWCANIMIKPDKYMDFYYFNHKNIVRANELGFVIEYSITKSVERNELTRNQVKIVNIINKSLGRGNCIIGSLINELYPNTSTVIFNMYKSNLANFKNCSHLQIDNLILLEHSEHDMVVQNPFEIIELFSGTKWFLFDDHKYTYKEYYYYKKDFYHFTDLFQKILLEQFKKNLLKIEGIMFYVKSNQVYNPPKLLKLRTFQFSNDDEYRWILYEHI